MNAIEITGLRKAYPDFELAGLDLCLPGGLSAKTARARARPSA